MKKNSFYLLASICLLFINDASFAQKIGTDIFLPGRYLEMGQNNMGAFGSSGTAPASYHPDPAGPLASVYDWGHDGWSVGSPRYFGDYTLPGVPYEGWAIQVGGPTGLNWAFTSNTSITGPGTLTGSNTTYSNSGGQLTANWAGTAASGQLSINMQTVVDTNASWVVVTVKMYNTGSSPLSNIYYMRGCDPDNDYTYSGDFGTDNSITYQNDAEHRVLASSTGATYTHAYLGLCTKDSRAKAFIQTEFPTDDYITNLSTLYTGTSGTTAPYTVGTSDVDQDYALGLIYNIGTIGAGDTTVISYAYTYNGVSGIDSAFSSAPIPPDTLYTLSGGGNPAQNVYPGQANVLLYSFQLSEPNNANELNGFSFLTRGGTATDVSNYYVWIAPKTGNSLTSVPATAYMLGSVFNEGPGMQSLYNFAIDYFALAAADSYYIYITANFPSTAGTGPGDSVFVAQVIGEYISTSNTIGTVEGSTTNGGTAKLAARTTSAYFSFNGNNNGATGSYQAYTVPLGVTQLNVTVAGAEGGDGGYLSGIRNKGGNGGVVNSTITLAPGVTTLYIYTGNSGDPYLGFTVGDNGGSNSNGGANGGNGANYGGGGGGGSTDIRTDTGNTMAALSSRIVTGGGGGGVGVYPYDSGPAYGGIGAYSGVTTGSGGGEGIFQYSGGYDSSIDGTPGTLTAGGDSAISGGGGAFGAGGNGGKGGTLTTSSSYYGYGYSTYTAIDYYGGGGGGGWYGASGAAYDGACGGSSYALNVTGVASVSATTYSDGANLGSGYVIITPVGIGVAGINGALSVCAGATTSLSDATTGGTWSSGNTAIATVDPTGIVTGIASGTAIITYSDTGGTGVTTIVTVNPLAVAGSITGTGAMCAGATTDLMDTASGGVWSSGSTGTATVGLTGIVTGVAGGTVIISYTVTNGCGGVSATDVVTVNALPTISAGANALICTGSSTTLTATGGVSYIWSPDATLSATTGASVNATPTTGDTYTVTGTDVNGCSNTATITVSVNQSPVVSLSGTPCTGSLLSMVSSAPYDSVVWYDNGTAVKTTHAGVFPNITSAGRGDGISPMGVFVDGSGDLFVVDQLGNRVLEYPAGYNSSTPGTVVAQMGLDYPWSVFVDGSGNIYVGNGYGNNVIKFPPGSDASTTGTVVAQNGFSSVVAGVSVDASGNIFAADLFGKQVLEYPAGSDSTTTPVVAASTAGYVEGIYLGVNDTLYLGDYTYDNIQRFNPLGGFGVYDAGTIVAGGNGSGDAANQFNAVTGVFVDNRGSIYVSDQTNFRIQKFPRGSTSATNGVTVAGVAAGTPLIESWLICGDNMGNIYTTDLNNQQVTIFAQGTFTDTLTSAMSGDYTVVVTGLYGCTGTTNAVTVNASPSAGTISGTTTVCVGATTNLTDAATGGVWSSNNTGVFTVGSATGVVTGVSANSAEISYTATNGCGTVAATAIVFVNPLPNAGSITGTTTVCVGAATNLTDATTGGVWSSNNTAVFTVGSTTGVVTGVSANSAEISYTATNGCGTVAATAIVYVNPLPNAGSITGTTTVCVGATTNLTDATTGGVWSSNNTAVFTVGSTTGVVTGVSANSAEISYTATNGCGTVAATAIVYVNPLPNAGSITGASSVNAGSNITLTDPADGGAGSWTASNANATVSGGLVTGETAGTVTISYSVSGSCGTAVATKVITINNSSLPGINGNTSLCPGGTTMLTDAITGGTWSMSSDVASVNGSTGVVTASASLTGTATVTYTDGGSYTTITVTVSANPAHIQGAISECGGATITLTDATAGGTWSATGGSITGTGTSATFTAGSVAGTATVTYTALGCNSPIFSNTIYANPQPIGGVFIMCTGITTLLTDATMSGTGGWSSSNTAVATVSGFHVTGQGAGTAVITYVVSPGNCSTTQEITVNAQPAGITGNTSPACPGASFTLADGTGVWSSSNTSVATVGTSGTVTGITGGTAAITYLASGIASCVAQTVVTIDAAPAAISGPGTVCSNGTITLSDLTNSGTWSSGNMTVATIGSANGVVSGVSGGTTAITYTTNIGGCQTATTVTVTTAPTAPGGTQRVCTGSVTTLTDATGGGVWSSSNSAVATIGSSGSPVTVTGVGAGTATMTYTSGSCYVTAPVTVNALPGAINGAASACTGTTTSLSDGTTGGLWSSSNTGAATIGSTTGLVTGVSAGTTTVSYTISSTGCSIGEVVTVTTTAGTITGNTPVCIGSNITLADGGGTWSSSNTAVATIIGSTGMVTGVAAGTSKISYVSGGCSATTIVTVSAGVGVIKGTASVCQNTTTSLSDATTGGTWSSSNTAIATVGSSTGTVAGVVTTVTIPATVSIIYTIPGTGSCTMASVTVTVNPLPGSINGNLSLCASGTSTLTDATIPGTWSMASSYASVGSATGVVTASATLTGTATISYTSGGCSVSNIVTVNANPKAVQAPTGECAGTTVTITDATAGGSWSGTGGNALVSGTGTSGTLVAGSTGGTETITYTIIATGCSSAVFTNTIYSNPAPITGPTFNLCTGVTVLLSDATMSGTGGWYSSNTAVATISGFHVTGQSAGTSVISYVVTPGNCSITQIVSVDVTPVVSAISGPASISESHPPVTLSDATGGGNWTSSNPSLIELLSGTSTPTVTAEALGSTGSAVISYTVVNGWCSTTATKTVGATTAAHPGGGTTTGNPTLVYAGSAVSLGGDAGGTWSSSDNGIATVDGSGLVTGITVGNVNITHVTTGDDGAVTTSVTPVVVTAVPASISLLPNPNKGTFVVRGTVGSVADEEVTLEVTDVLGQVIYKSKVIAEGGRLNETIMLGNALANGMYILNVQSETTSKTFHFVIAD